MDKEQKELREAARPLVEYLRKKHTPMATAIVTGGGVEVLSTDIHVTFNDDWDNDEWCPEDSLNGRLENWKEIPNVEISSQKK